MNAERAALEKQLEGEKASAAEKVKRLGEFKDKIAGEKASLEKNLAALKDEVGKVKGEADNLKGQLATAQKEHGRYMAAVDQLQKDNAGLSGDLKKAQANLDAKKKLAKKIADNLAKNGIKAGVDGKTGDVTIQFGDEYFDTGRADLKPNMKQVLQKFVPTYSKSLLEDEKVAKEISSVEIVGFSSPTYQGRYVDPASLDIKDRAAVSYNLDLSYNRAKSIFNYMFDKNTMTYAHQKDMLPLVKVTGRSFLAEEVKGRNIASGLAIKDYCAQYNCEKSQKVIIRFNLKD
jgi:outer membrane protein OmpA-like peptidoglycan-associated protein